MKINIQPIKKTKNKIPQRAVAVLMLCAMLFCVVPLSAHAEQTALLKATMTVTELNIRSGPGTGYSIVETLGLGDVVYLTGQTATSGAYVWYRLYGTSERWIAATGGWTYESVTLYADTVNGYDAYGAIVWTHDCTFTDDDYYLHFEVYESGYSVACDCGWMTMQTTDAVLNSSGEVIMQFLGLDTDYDELLDLRPGQTRDILHSAINNLRDLPVLEMYGNPNNHAPTVTLKFATADHELIAEYIFDWWVDVRIEPYGIVMKAMNGEEIIHVMDCDFMLYDRLGGFYLGDTPTRYKHGDLFSDDRNLEYVFTLAPVGDGDLPFMEWVIHLTQTYVGDFVSMLADFFGLGFIFTDEDSPFAFIVSGMGRVQDVFQVIRAFFDILPKEVLFPVLLAFTGTAVALIIGRFR